MLLVDELNMYLMNNDQPIFLVRPCQAASAIVFLNIF